MSKSPGHHKWPDHKVEEKPVGQTVQVAVDGEIVAESANAVQVEEDNHPVRYYFPRADVKMDKLKRSAKTSECPFKGHANYFTLNAAGESLDDAVWTYEDPYEEHQGLKERLAFANDRYRQIDIRTTA